MIREAYVGEDGRQADYKKVYIKRYLIVFGIILAIIVIFLIYSISKSASRQKFCQNMKETIKKASLKYAEDKEILPSIEGDYTNFSVDDLIKEHYVNKEDLTVKDHVATSDIKITKYIDDYIVTMDLDQAEYCSTVNKSWGRETEKYDKNKDIVSVTAYYNYRNKETNYTNWSSEVFEKDLKTKKDKTFNIYLPKAEDVLPEVPSDAEIQEIEVMKNVYYQYQDKEWKYYNIIGDYTNYFSSEKPNGYEKYDENTVRYTDWTEYSLNYPEEKEYREIQTIIGYKWYYMDGKKKIYYNNGNYTPEAPKKYDQTEEETVSMYRYQDCEYRWYNGEQRFYSGYSSTVLDGYPYRDDDLFSYTSLSALSKESSLNDSNRSYRVEEVLNYYQFRIKYDVYSLNILDTDLKKDEFLEKVDASLEEMMNDDKYDVKITYKFRYK